MNVLVFLNALTLGGTEKAACLWAGYLAGRIRNGTMKTSGLSRVSALSLEDGPRRGDLKRMGVALQTFHSTRPPTKEDVAEAIAQADVIHAHAPGFPHQGDILGAALRYLGRKIPVVQTNIFGKLENPPENEWTDFRIFISWTSCVQAARRAGRKLDREFFRRQSVAVYPVEDPLKGKTKSDKQELESGRFRESLGILPEHILFGRFSRPEPNKWSPLVLEAFLAAHRENHNLRLLLREPPPNVAQKLRDDGLALPQSASDRANTAQPDLQSAFPKPAPPVLILPATADSDELTINQMACDVILHTSSIGESFGYGLAEPMALGKPVISNSVPWHDQAQIELVRHGECGYIASTHSTMKEAILCLTANKQLRSAYGPAAKRHILQVADPVTSTNRLEMALHCASTGIENPLADFDVETANQTAEYLDQHQWGHSMSETLYIKRFNAWVKFRHWQRAIRNNILLKYKSIYLQQSR